MDPEFRKRIQLVLIIGLLLAAARVAYVFYERSQPAQPKPAPAGYQLQADDYVLPPKIYAYDLKSAQKELRGKTVWVRTGNVLPYYHYDAARRSADLAHKMGVLAPLEELQIKDVILQKIPAKPVPGEVVVVRKQVLAVYDKPGTPDRFAFSLGTTVGDDYSFTANEELFFADPHDLYKHWPADVWNAIGQRQVKKGMNELQAGFALGNAVGASAGDYGNRWLQYRDGGKLVKVTFVQNRATQIETGDAATEP